MTGYQKGRRREYQSCRLLEAAGYTVFRCAGSHGVADLIGVGPQDVVLVQVKSKRLPSPNERSKFQALRRPLAVRLVIHVWKTFVRDPDIIEL